VVVLALAVATAVLLRSFTRQLKKIDFEEEPQRAAGRARPAAGLRGPAAGGSWAAVRSAPVSGRNRLADATSPYLLQHADNPVDWWQWGDEAFAEARRRDVPVLLSVGYAACHWCHVMAHESFEDQQTAAYLNEHFVCVKVDREERPDVDAVYMTATQAMTGHGGWPMTCVLTPEGEPFFCGTYFPPGPGTACRPSSRSWRPWSTRGPTGATRSTGWAATWWRS
jgi:hypothetical protein